MTQAEMQAHTPGPWKAYRSAVQDANGRIIVTQSWTNRLTDDQYTEPVKAVLLANARLIAAAPDLLEACESLARLFSEQGVPIPLSMKTAIAKAKGESP